METWLGELSLLGKVLLRALALTAVMAAVLLVSVLAGRVLPGGEEIAFALYDGTNPDIYRMDIDHNLRFNLTHRSGYDSNPAWSQDGSWIVFTSDREGAVNVYVMDAIGRAYYSLVPEGSGFFHTARWSEDGQHVYLFQGAQDSQRIFSVQLDGSDFYEVTEEVSAGLRRDFDIDPHSLSLSISPDGDRSAFVAFRNGQWGIYLADERRRNAHMIAAIGRQYNEQPIWSRDGEHVAYVARMDGRVDVYLIHTNTPTPVPQRLTHDLAIEASISWRP
ncbi:MAG: PD40 domain-containing protein [Anaerolineae bacterium]|nr:PD40 domain-containing protein [Anaerolineae bacterium]